MKATITRFIILLVIILSCELIADSKRPEDILISNTITAQSSQVHNDKVSRISPMAASEMGTKFNIRFLSETNSNDNTVNSALTQNINSNSVLLAELVTSGSGQKEIVWDPDNDWQRITYNCDINLELDVVYNTQRGDIYQYVIVELRGTIHFWGTAEDYYYGSYNTWNFDDTRNYTIANPPDGLLEYAVSKGRVTYVQSSLSSGTGDVVPYYIQFFGLAHSYSARVLVDLPSNWYFDDEYYNCNPGMGVDLTDSVIITPRAYVSYDSNKFQYNEAYPGNWRMVALDAYVQADFELDSLPGSAKLVIDHLSSSHPNCPNNGYSPVDVIVNGDVVESCYDPAENHGGTHSFVTDQWEVGPYLQIGTNTIRVQLCGTACSHYWIRYLYIDDLGDDCASCNLQTIRVTEISVRENVPIKDVPDIIWTEAQPDVFHPVADATYGIEDFDTMRLMYKSSQGGYTIHPLTKWGLGVSFNVEKQQGIGDYHICEITYKIVEITDDAKPLKLPSSQKKFFIDVPHQIGKYTLNLTFKFLDQYGKVIGIPQEMDHEVYVVYSDPVIGRPQLDWIEMATKRAQGARTDVEVLQNLNINLRTEAQNQNWVYSNVYWEWPWTLGKPEYAIWIWSNTIGGLHKDLLYNNAKYGDCVTFTRAWQHLAETLGVPARRTRVDGKFNKGYITDPSFQTVALTGATPNTQFEDGAFDRWRFDSHTIGWYSTGGQRVYYDPTFSETYPQKKSFILDEVKTERISNGKIYWETENGNFVFLSKKPGPDYLTGSYIYSTVAPSSTVVESALAQVVDNSTAAFTGLYSVYGLDTNDGTYNALVFDIEVDGNEGDYIVLGTLYNGGNFISNRSSAHVPVFTSDQVSLSGTGPNMATIFFSGEDIYQSGLDGIFTAELYLIGPNSIVFDYNQFDTNTIDHYLFGEEPARMIGFIDSGVDDNNDGLFDLLVTEIQLDIVQFMDYGAVVSLSSDPNSDPFEWANGKTDPNEPNIICVRFDGRVINELQIDGPYFAEVRLYDSNDNYITSKEYITSAYSADMFERPPARFTGNCTDHIVFSGSGCPLNSLVIDVEVEVNEPNIYEITGWLFASDCNVIEIIPIEPNLGIGTTIVSLEFNGECIADYGLDGPYYLSYIAMREWNAENNGYLTTAKHIHETAPYTVCSFDPNTTFYSGDLDCSCTVDFEDFAVFALAWLTGEGEGQYNPACDISLPADSFIDEKDLKIFTNNWLAGK